MLNVKAMIDDLTIQRDTLTTAIEGLQALSNNGATAAVNVTPKVPFMIEDEPRRLPFTKKAKRAMVREMASATRGERQTLAEALAGSFGGSPSTILTSWKKWQAQLAK